MTDQDKTNRETMENGDQEADDGATVDRPNVVRVQSRRRRARVAAEPGADEAAPSPRLRIPFASARRFPEADLRDRITEILYQELVTTSILISFAVVAQAIRERIGQRRG